MEIVAKLSVVNLAALAETTTIGLLQPAKDGSWEVLGDDGAPVVKVELEERQDDGPDFCENCAMDLATCDCVESKPLRTKGIDWKARALAAEELNRKFMSSVNGPAHMGEPVVAQLLSRKESDAVENAVRILDRVYTGDSDFWSNDIASLMEELEALLDKRGAK